MPPESHQAGSPTDWLRHAESDLELARVPLPPRALLEGLCFHCQQTAEKALKAVLVDRGVPFPKTHNIRTLLDLLPKDLTLPAGLEDVASLTDYGVLTRYPASVEPVDEQEYEEALRLAEAVLNWAQSVIAQ